MFNVKFVIIQFTAAVTKPIYFADHSRWGDQFQRTYYGGKQNHNKKSVGLGAEGSY